MNLHENTVFGRKVFFLYPPYDVEKIVLQKLSDMEYEIYTINDWKQAKTILRKYPDSICFINIDAAMPAENWFNFVMSFEQDEKLSTIFLGVISERARKVDRERFMLHATIPAGYINMNMDLEDLTQTLASILEINGAKGRRKYVRAEGIKDNSVYGSYHLSSHNFTFHIDSISSVGISGVLPIKYLQSIPVNTVFRDLTIVLYDKDIHCNAAVIANKLGSETFTMVLLFLKGTAYSTKSAIRAFIRNYLQNAIMAEIVRTLPDTTDYSQAIASAYNTNYTSLSSTDIEEIEEAEEVEEAESVEDIEVVKSAENTLSTKIVTEVPPSPEKASPSVSNIKPIQTPLKNGGEQLDSTITSLF